MEQLTWGHSVPHPWPGKGFNPNILVQRHDNGGLCQYVIGLLNTSPRASKTKRAGWQGFWREYFGRTWREHLSHFTHQFVSCSLSFSGYGKSANLCSWAWLRPWLSTVWICLHLISRGVQCRVCITHCTTIRAILTIDDLEGREACQSCSWLLTGARQRLAVDVFPWGYSEV